MASTTDALSIASDYFAWFLSAHLALISHNARERLAQVLLSLAEGIGHDAPDGVELNITNEELANAANVIVFTASRILSEWRRNGALLKSRGKVVLRSPRRLLLHPSPALEI
jgi:CRP/FNR family transcriptional regulator, nitrogen oxide reductase regulator